jgi:hypothetical protein
LNAGKAVGVAAAVRRGGQGRRTGNSCGGGQRVSEKAESGAGRQVGAAAGVDQQLPGQLQQERHAQRVAPSQAGTAGVHRHLAEDVGGDGLGGYFENIRSSRGLF